MRIKLNHRCNLAAAKGAPGEVLTVDDAVGKELLARGGGDVVVETATKPEPENAAARTKRPTKK